MVDRVALLRRTFGEEVRCQQCGGKLRLIALVKTEETIQALLTAMHLPRVFHSPGPPKVVNPGPPITHEKANEWGGGEAGEAGF